MEEELKKGSQGQ